jgi:hypothetical protein
MARVIHAGSRSTQPSVVSIDSWSCELDITEKKTSLHFGAVLKQRLTRRGWQSYSPDAKRVPDARMCFTIPSIFMHLITKQ